jgi:hypothetical protein
VQVIVVGADAVANILPSLDGVIKQLVVSHIVVLSVTILACSFCGHRQESEARRRRSVAILYVACGFVAHYHGDRLLIVLTVRESVYIAFDLVPGLLYLTISYATLLYRTRSALISSRACDNNNNNDNSILVRNITIKHNRTYLRQQCSATAISRRRRSSYCCAAPADDYTDISGCSFDNN